MADQMNPADVPDDLVQAAARGMSNRKSPEGINYAPDGWWEDDARAALAAVLPMVDAKLRAETALTKELLQRNVDLGTRADNAEAERDDLRARLDGLRPAGFEYGYGPDAATVSLCGTSVAAYDCAREDGVNVYVMDRYLGPWRAVANGDDDA
jgi:hypothetical protein